MAVVSHKSTRMTAEDLLSPNVPEKFVELVEGELVTMTPAGHHHNRVCMNLAFLFRAFCETRPYLDYSGDNNGFLISRAPDCVLSPDACLFKARPHSCSTWLEFAPELVVEVLSPGNTKTEMAFKRQRFFDAGTEQFWLVEPDTNSIQIFHADGRVEGYSGKDAIVPGEGVANGLNIPLSEVFRAR